MLNHPLVAALCEFATGIAVLLFSYLMYVRQQDGLALVFTFVAGFAFIMGLFCVYVYFARKRNPNVW